MAYDHSKVTNYIGETFALPAFKLPSDQYTGGNDLDKAPEGRVTDFVREHGGHTVITKVFNFAYGSRLTC